MITIAAFCASSIYPLPAITRCGVALAHPLVASRGLTDCASYIGKLSADLLLDLTQRGDALERSPGNLGVSAPQMSYCLHPTYSFKHNWLRSHNFDTNTCESLICHPSLLKMAAGP